MKNLVKLALILSIIMGAVACKKEDNTPKTETPNTNVPSTPEGMVKIGETYVLGAKAKAYIYAPQALFTGYNKIYVALFDSVDGSRLTDGHFHFGAMMDMGMMKHSCPVEENEDIDPATNLYSSALVFIMPTAGMGKWYLHIGYHNHKNDLEGEGEIEVTVNDASPKRLYSSVLVDDDSAKVFVSFVLPSKGKVGLNDAEFTIHKRNTMMDFPAITDYTIEMIPTMPTMGHGSPNNVNPVHTAKGHYTGKLNFTMTGLWRIQLKLSKNGKLLTDQIFFDITF
jgi:hypothetical protein